jgi:hypothetical protein
VERLLEGAQRFVSAQSAYVAPKVSILDELADAEGSLEEESLLASSK